MNGACSCFALGLLAVLVCGQARAGDSVCWILNGVLLAPAIAAGVDGVFILDTGQARSQLDATQASEADIGVNPSVGDVRLAGTVIPRVSMPVEALDARTRDFPIPIAGVLGADVLAGQVLEVRPDPCRLRLEPSHAAVGEGLSVELRGGVPYVRAGISSGPRTLFGPFRVATGSPAPVVLGASQDLAPSETLRALSLDGKLLENLQAVLPPAPGADDAIGEPVWSRFTMRLDFGRRTLSLRSPDGNPGSSPVGGGGWPARRWRGPRRPADAAE